MTDAPTLSATLKTRVSEETKAELERRADESHRTPAALARLAILHYLTHWSTIEGEQTRVA